MEFIKITDVVRPNFNETVFLLEKQTDKKTNVVAAGYLKSIDSNGLNFHVQGQENPFDVFFGGSVSAKATKFKPTHFCRIVLPNE